MNRAMPDTAGPHNAEQLAAAVIASLSFESHPIFGGRYVCEIGAGADAIMVLEPEEIRSIAINAAQTVLDVQSAEPLEACRNELHRLAATFNPPAHPL